MKERLRRLVESDVCDAKSVNEHKDSLIELANSVASREELKRKKRFLKALADEKRLQVLKLLGIRDMCVCELSAALEASQPNLSHHLRILENENIISRIQKGKWAFYSIVKNQLLDAILEN